MHLSETTWKTDYPLMIQQLEGLADLENHYLALLSNASALIWENMADINWAGFYLMEGDSLMLGPFQGKVACVRIAVGKGVCGTAVARQKSLVVENVHTFEGHIACDSASNSEVVVPLWYHDRIVGVLDIDSPSLNRFNEDDRKGLEAFCQRLMALISYPEAL